MVERVRIPGMIPRYRVGGSVKTHPDNAQFGNRTGKRGGARKKTRVDDMRGKTGNQNGKRHYDRRTKESKEIRAKAAASGELPHEFMLRVMRTPLGQTCDDHIVTWEDKQWAAQGCINYYAPKLQSINVGGSKEVIRILHIESHQLQGLTLDELALLEKVFGRLEAMQRTETDTQLLIEANPDDYEATLH